jgi:hypothetical protein
MSPTFEEIVNWLKTIEEGQQTPPELVQKPRVKQAAAVPAEPAESTPVLSAEPPIEPVSLKNPLIPADLTAGRLAQGIIFSEILGRPISRRNRFRRH